MKVWIEKPVEPSRLLLAWQAPEGQLDRRRWVVGVIETCEASSVFRYFDAEELTFRNDGRSLAQLKAAGFVSYPAFSFLPGKVFDQDVLPTFMRRLPPITRSDFSQYQAYFSIAPDTSLSGPMLLALTEARLPSDGFSLVDPFDSSAQVCDASFEIAGFRYEASACRPEAGSHLSLRLDPHNIHDPNAVAVFWNESRIGFVNRLQAPAVGEWLFSRNVSCDLLRLNGRTDAPRAYARIRVRPKAEVLAA